MKKKIAESKELRSLRVANDGNKYLPKVKESKKIYKRVRKHKLLQSR